MPRSPNRLPSTKLVRAEEKLRVLVAGAGYVGRALGEMLAGQGHEVFALRRRPEGLEGPLRPFAADLGDPSTLTNLPPGIDVVFYTAGADERSDEAYERAYVRGLDHLLSAFDAQHIRPRRLLYTSSTAVYGQTDGEDVDETSATEPRASTGRILLRGERAALDNGLVPAIVLRLGGIYGPGRDRLLRQVASGQAQLTSRPHFTNRIHRDDCAGALAHLMSLADPEPIYLGVDHAPTDRNEVLRFLAAELSAPPPAEGEATSARLEGGHKRCRNDRLVASGYRFAFPSFREGYRPMIADFLRNSGSAT